jgi:hypothetical protein
MTDLDTSRSDCPFRGDNIEGRIIRKWEGAYVLKLAPAHNGWSKDMPIFVVWGVRKSKLFWNQRFPLAAASGGKWNPERLKY